MQKERRESNFELLRIISMMLIVMHHYAVHGGFDSLSGGKYSFPLFFIQILLIGGKLGVNCFVLISGYFLIEASENKLRILRIWIQTFFYSMMFWGIDYIINGNFNGNELFKAMFPVIFEEYWFVSAYFFMCLFATFINKYIKALEPEQLLKNIYLMMVLWSVLPTIWNMIPVDTKPSFQLNSFLWFCNLYIIGAYIRIHVRNEDKGYIKYFVRAVGIYSLIAFSIAVFDVLGSKFGIFQNSAYVFASDNSILMVLMSISLFMGFRNLKIPCNKMINIIASSTFGVYLIHDNKYMRKIIWNELLKNSMFIDSPFLGLHALISISVIFCVCVVIDSIRRKVFETIEKLIKNSDKIKKREEK